MSKRNRFLLGWIGFPVLIGMWIALIKGVSPEKVVIIGGLTMLIIYLVSTLR